MIGIINQNKHLFNILLMQTLALPILWLSSWYKCLSSQGGRPKKAGGQVKIWEDGYIIGEGAIKLGRMNRNLGRVAKKIRRTYVN